MKWVFCATPYAGSVDEFDALCVHCLNEYIAGKTRIGWFLNEAIQHLIDRGFLREAS